MSTADQAGGQRAAPQLTDTLATRPELWDGPAWMLVASRPNQPAALAVSGYCRRLAEWEGRFGDLPSVGSMPDVPALDLHVHDPAGLLDHRSWTSVELDLVDDTLEPAHLAAIVEYVANDHAGAARAAMRSPSVPVSANRSVDVAPPVRGAADLIVPTLPSRRDQPTLPLAFGHRRVRLVAGRSWHIAAWGRMQGRWERDVVRWPHFGIPSRTAGWRSGRFAEHAPPTNRLAGFMIDLCEHVEYQLGTWTVEHELWEQELFRSLASGSSTFEGVDLERARQELSQFAEFLALVRQAQRGLRRRPEVDVFLATPPVRKLCHASAERVGLHLDTRRDHVREAFALLADIAAGVQAHAVEQQRTATEHLQQTITVVTTALLVPALVVSVYGANLRELSVDARGDLPTLAALMATSSVVTTIVMRASRSQPLVVRSVTANAVIALVAGTLTVGLVAGIASGRLAGAGWGALLVGSAVAATSAILGHLTRRRGKPPPTVGRSATSPSPPPTRKEQHEP